MEEVDRKLEELRARLVGIVSEPDTWGKVLELHTLAAQLRAIALEVEETAERYAHGGERTPGPPNDAAHTHTGRQRE